MYLARRNPFLRAVAIGDLQAVSRMLDQRANIEQTDQNGYSAVHIAILNRNLPMLKLLANRGASLRKPAKNSNGIVYYPVETAIRSGFIEGLRFIVDEKKVSLYSSRLKRIETLLFQALEDRNNILTLRYLIEEKRLDPRRAITSDNFTLLHQAEIANVHPAIVEYLLRRGVNPDIECSTISRRNSKDPRREYDGLPLAMAAFKGEPERVIPYLLHDADPSQKNGNFKTAHDAAAEKYRPAYDRTKRDFDNTTRLLNLAGNGRALAAEQNQFVLACAMGDLNEVERRLKAREDPDQMDSKGMTGIHTAIMSRDMELLQLLIDYNANPRLHIGNDESRQTPVELAIEEGFLHGLHFLVEDVGVKLEPRPGQNIDDLLFRAFERNDNILTLRWLVERKGLDPAKAGFHEGADILEESEFANSFLTYTEYLMLAGMDPNNETPERDRAMSEIDLYDTAGAIEESYNGLPLVRSAFNLEAALVDLYLDYKADPLKWNRHNNTAWDAASDRLNPNLEDEPADGELIRQKLLRAANGLAEKAAPPALPPGPS